MGTSSTLSVQEKSISKFIPTFTNVSKVEIDLSGRKFLLTLT